MNKGTVYQRGQIWWIKYYRNGEPFFESSKSTKKMVANELLEKRLNEISQGQIPGVRFEKVTFKELSEDFVRDRRVNGKSVRDAEKRIRHLRPFFKGFRAVDVTTTKVNEYIDQRLEEGAANGTINRELAALKRMLNLGKRHDKVNRVPHIPSMKENNTRKGFFERRDFLALREALPDYLRDFITLAYKTGWRVSEITGLTWNQVDLDQGIIRLEVGTTKNKEGRTFYLDDELRGILEQKWYEKLRRDDSLPYVFLNTKGDDKVKRFDKSWRKGCDAAGIGKRLFHDFRRTAVRNMVRAGVPERVAMMVSGHKTRSVFERYNIVNDADLRMATRKQEEYLNSQMVTKRLQSTETQEKRANEYVH
jgi:integrase